MREMVDRERERRQLLEASQATPSLIVVIGRRRVGKSFLLERTFAGDRVISLQGDEQDERHQLELFAAEAGRVLLGTDALRDGVDVPGRSLRLVVFDKVPWPRPTILHKARRARFGRSYDDLLTRLRLKQAFGRLIRSQSDRGCFVILESATPSRLLTALPAEAPVKRCGLAEAVVEIRDFLN